MGLFVDVLLSKPSDPAVVANSDLNCDGDADGQDIQPFVDILVP